MLKYEIKVAIVNVHCFQLNFAFLQALVLVNRLKYAARTANVLTRPASAMESTVVVMEATVTRATSVVSVASNV